MSLNLKIICDEILVRCTKYYDRRKFKEDYSTENIFADQHRSESGYVLEHVFAKFKNIFKTS